MSSLRIKVACSQPLYISTAFLGFALVIFQRVSFMGEECVMPESYPSLPSGAARQSNIVTAAASSAIAMFVVLLLL